MSTTDVQEIASDTASFVRASDTVSATGGLQRLSWEMLDRLEWQLWTFAAVIIVILGAGLLSFMFPNAFWLSMNFMIKSQDRAFWGFLVLVIAAIAYIFDKERGIRRFRKKLLERLTAELAKQDLVLQSLKNVQAEAHGADTRGEEHSAASLGTGAGSLYQQRSVVALRIALHLTLDPSNSHSRILNAWTTVLNRHGAIVECIESIPVGTKISVTVITTGRSETGRVRWENQQCNSRGLIEFAIELPRAEHFWGVNFPQVSEAA